MAWHGVADGGGGDVGALGDLGVAVPEQLHAEQPSGAGDSVIEDLDHLGPQRARKLAVAPSAFLR